MTNRNKLGSKLFILIAVLLFAWVGVSCKNKPTEEGGMLLEKPDDKNDTIGGDGRLTDPTLIEKYKKEMINIRLISDSSDGVAYYRAPVVVTYGTTGMGMAIFYEKRFGQGGDGDVGVDGKAKVDIVFMSGDKGGDGLYYDSDNKVGNDPSAGAGDPQYSRGSPVVFVKPKGTDIAVVAAAGAGTMGGTSGRGESELKIVRGTANGSTINFGGWQELEIEYTNNNVTNKGSEAIRKYVKEKIGSEFTAFYTRWGQGKMDGDTWVLPLKLIQRKSDGSTVGNEGAILVLYSTNSGTNWAFGPHIKLGPTSYNEATGLSVSGKTVKLAMVPRNYHNPVGIYKGELTNGVELTLEGKSSFNDSYNNFEMNKKDADNAYFINTRERSSKFINGFIVNKKLTIALLNDPADTLQEKKSMLMSRLAGSGSVAVLDDGTILTVAEEAFAEKVREGENRYNIVQRRFTKGYVENHQRIDLKEEYYNPNYPEDSY